MRPSGASPELLQCAIQRDAAANALLRKAIELQSKTMTYKPGEYLAWADCIRPLPMSEMPTKLYEELDQFCCQSLHVLAIPDPCPIHPTEWLPRKTQPKAVKGFNPKSINDLLTPEALRLIEQWLQTQLLFLEDILNNGKAATRKSNTPLALGQGHFVEQAGS